MSAGLTNSWSSTNSWWVPLCVLYEKSLPHFCREGPSTTINTHLPPRLVPEVCVSQKFFIELPVCGPYCGEDGLFPALHEEADATFLCSVCSVCHVCCELRFGLGTPYRTRTCDPRIRNPLFYPTELRERVPPVHHCKEGR